MSDSGYAQRESPAQALRNIGLSSRDLMAAINRLGSGLEIINVASPESPSTSRSYRERAPEEHILDKFTLFSELPSELRIKIWTFVCFQPRNVDIFTENLGTIRVSVDTQFETYRFYSHFCSHPSLLHACQEAREEGLKYYKLEYGTSHHFSLINISTPPRIYVNFACDRLCLLNGDSLKSDLEDRFEQFVGIVRKHGARSLAINIARDQHWPFVDVATSSNTLEELVLFGSSQNFHYLPGGTPIEFMKPRPINDVDYRQACIQEDAVRQVVEEDAVRQLEIARRDYLALFEMHQDGLQFEPPSPNGSLTMKMENDPWKPPVVKICHLSIGGEQDANDWAMLTSGITGIGDIRLTRSAGTWEPPGPLGTWTSE
ncbi:hypothetical protein NA56DRAFT_657100 [Hyaloscypha hepaticicola]|uniref:2EXR domain-containing protein n=1 Tax=Hyaloscypha hepaticicola TaxID=2082293 RepID=A0A2J6QC63_9HELO|nr:hypothetical protein NA56DRAFT_657100 [Hyaloscypha hepaticicola]